MPEENVAQEQGQVTETSSSESTEQSTPDINSDLQDRYIQSERERREMSKENREYRELVDLAKKDQGEFFNRIGVSEDDYLNSILNKNTQLEKPETGIDPQLKKRLEKLEQFEQNYEQQSRQQVERDQYQADMNYLKGELAKEGMGDKYEQLHVYGDRALEQVRNRFYELESQRGYRPDINEVFAQVHTELDNWTDGMLDKQKKTKKYSNRFGSNDTVTLSNMDTSFAPGSVDTASMSERERRSYHIALAKQRAAIKTKDENGI